MTAPTSPTKDQDRPDPVRQPSLITREVLEGYLNCKYKGHLKLKGEQGTKSDYEAMMSEWRIEHKRRACDKLALHYREGEILREVEVSVAVLRKGVPLILDPFVRDDTLSLRWDGLKRIEGPSRLGSFHYIPILFNEGEKIRREQRWLLELCGLIIGDIQEKQPAHGIVILGDRLTAAKIELKAGPRQARRYLEEIKKLVEVGSPPDFLLNDHCQICEYRERCHLQAVKEDNLSLLRGMGEKTIKKLKRRGITTITQLSSTYRPRKKYGKDRAHCPPHSFALQAMAVREKKVFILGAPELPNAQVTIFFDVEGDPERKFDYLIGVLIEKNGTEERYSLWADSPDQEEKIVEQFLEIVERYENPRLFSYGSYEAAFLRRMRQPSRKERIDRVLDRTTNALSVIYSNVYFPVYSNGLKEVGGRLGCRWTGDNASGLQSIVWRRSWEVNRDEGLKRMLEVYNMEDCVALRDVVRFINGITVGNKSENDAEGSSGTVLDYARVEEKGNEFSRREWCKANFSLPDFNYINMLSYFDYQREKVFIRTSPVLKRSRLRKRKKRRTRPHVEEQVMLRSESCPYCGGNDLREKHDGRLARLVMDLKVSRKGIRRRWIEVVSYRYLCLGCRRSFVPPDYFRVDRHSHSLKSWAMYEHVAHRASFLALQESIKDSFGMRVYAPTIHMFQFLLADYYKETLRLITKRIVTGKLIHADETEVYVKGLGKVYVWVFTSLEEVVYLYRPNREGDFLHDLLSGFEGVLVSDFYAAYDSLPCKQQKCLIHLIRDFNHDILGNPFDEDLKSLAADFGILLRKVVTTIDRHGLKCKHLGCHKKEVNLFFEAICNREYRSEVARGYQKRLEKYREKLFTFIDHDGVPWNNNNAEHAIKKFAHYREIADGVVSERCLRDYLALLSIHQTCAYRGISFLRFLLSQERDIDAFSGRGHKPGKVEPFDLYPEGFVPSNRKR